MRERGSFLEEVKVVVRETTAGEPSLVASIFVSSWPYISKTI